MQDMGKNIFPAAGENTVRGQRARNLQQHAAGLLMAGNQAKHLALGVKNGLDPVVLSENHESKSSGGEPGVERV